MINFNLIISFVAAYLLGSIPFAYLALRLFTGTDIRKVGSGNVGAMNSYESSGNRFIGVGVFGLDFAKGIFAVAIAKNLCSEFLPLAAAALFVVIGHNFSAFLKFRGGRGLAAAAGASVMINPLMLFVWAFLWLVGFFAIKRDVHVGNIFATVLTPVFVWLVPEYFIFYFQTFPEGGSMEITYLTISVCFVIMLKHLGPLREMFRRR